MPGDNFSRRVARAATMGSGRGYRRRTPLGWYMALIAICVAGVGLVAFSRYERTHPTVASTSSHSTLPSTSSLWKVGLQADICGKTYFFPRSKILAEAFTTNGHGLVTIEPSRAPIPSASTGRHAVLSAFLGSVGASISRSSLTLPAPNTAGTTTTSTTSTTTSSTTSPSSSSTTSPTTTVPPKPPTKVYRNGDNCMGKKGLLRVMTWKSPSETKGQLVKKSPGDLRFKNGQLITLAFLPKGTTIPKPVSATAVRQFLISNPAGLLPSQPSASTPPTSVPSSSPTSSVPAGPTTTAPSGSSPATTSKGSPSSTT